MRRMAGDRNLTAVPPPLLAAMVITPVQAPEAEAGQTAAPVHEAGEAVVGEVATLAAVSGVAAEGFGGSPLPRFGILSAHCRN